MRANNAALSEQPDTPRRRGRRNVNGEGNIRLRKDGRYEGRTFVRSTDGTYKRVSKYGDTWEAVHEQLTALKAKSHHGETVPTGRMTVGDYLNYWMTEVVRDRVRPTTYSSYEQLVRSYILPGIGKKSLIRLSAPDLRTFLNQVKRTCQCCALGKDARRPESKRRCCARKPRECCEAYLGDGTVRYIHRVLRVALQDAILDGLLTQNVAKNLRLNFKYRPRFTPLTADEARAVLKAARGDRLYALYAVALAVGLRRGEALGLRRSDVNLDRAILHVRQAVHRVDGALTIGPVKTADSERSLALPAPLVQALRDHLDAQAAERERVGKAWKDHDLLFPTTIGTPMDPRNLNRHFAALCDAAGVRRVRFHDLRHSCATLLYEQGVKIENIQDVLGHSSPTITKTLYVDPTDKVLRDAVDKLGFLFDE
jgi:integrase